MARVEERMRVPEGHGFPHEINFGDVGFLKGGDEPKEFTVLDVGEGGLINKGDIKRDRKGRVKSISFGGTLAISEIGDIVDKLSREEMAEALREQYKMEIPKDVLDGLKKNPVRTLTTEDFEAAKAWQAEVMTSLTG